MTESRASGPSPEPPSDEEVADAARLAKDATASAMAAAELARSAGSGFWKALSALTSPVDTATTIAKQAAASTGFVDEGLQRVRQAAAPVFGSRDSVDALVDEESPHTAAQLRRRGDKLLGVSHKAQYQPRDVHPSFSGILNELTPDEARILRFLAVAGPQPVIDIRTKSLFQVGSKRLAGGISMIAEMAGCRYQDRDHHYFANLNRLGLLNFSKEPVDDFRRYALIEAQPVAMAITEHIKKTISIYRSIELTPFGSQFVTTCFDLTGYNAGGWDDNDRGDKTIGKGPPSRRKPKPGKH
ncbi:DUF4393 domain-containing protein [Skermania sp. ID1734]|uniref:Abi-alpha family protein n=1 Tax=Skermania sp. ID1734 TaxID=2597516 RepID=UPI00117D6D4E|nr:Abi-alpha family protein [Skermania sp. ID1734]TSD94420.1 DUF4393 domain-containing protein [Skermania sp. ID1734]